MHRLSRQDLRSIISVAMTVIPKSISWKLKSRDGFHKEQGQRELADHICDQIDNDSVMVIAAESVGEPIARRRGKWGIDEPVPATLAVFPQPPDDQDAGGV